MPREFRKVSNVSLLHRNNFYIEKNYTEEKFNDHINIHTSILVPTSVINCKS